MILPIDRTVILKQSTTRKNFLLLIAIDINVDRGRRPRMIKDQSAVVVIHTICSQNFYTAIVV
ncbi:Uncharacterised protein [Vibrio cholerae]|nr:Uncharacterised protein [Vibrio cholerae]CSC82230.1 Uncharacterised protein [Vibrio cholerae]CSC90241.1 Uncharacterised protein [Vibrio cholerae]CSD23562.1 Uncharacterised protein [Vibrio cholerae]CSD57179.1 Uncharacterised protein [Vibrio cholerae]